MNITKLGEGTRLQLEISGFVDDSAELFFISQLEWTEDDATAFIAAPMQDGMVYPIQKGTTLDIGAIQKGDFYQFKALVLERGVKDKIPLLKIQVLGDFQRIQRREFFRLECSLGLQYCVVDGIDALPEEKTGFKKAVTRDLSGGGLCMAVGEKVKLNTFIFCSLPLEERQPIEFFGKVVRVDECDKGAYKYELGITYEKIEEKSRQAIISYIFAEQRKLRQKGLI